MSKTARRLNRDAGKLIRGLPRLITKRELGHMEGKHRRWPLGTSVVANTPVGLLEGQVFKHWRSTEVPHGCSVEFPEPVDLGDANGKRYCHVIPFRNLKPTNELEQR